MTDLRNCGYAHPGECCSEQVYPERGFECPIPRVGHTSVPEDRLTSAAVEEIATRGDGSEKGEPVGSAALQPVAPATALASTQCPVEDGERCQSCGHRFLSVYWLPDDVWAAITPKPEHTTAGTLCLPCADKRAREAGIDLYWGATVGDFPHSTQTGEPK